jgi:hypothetical protein
MSKARNLANLISDGLVDTAEIADGAITQAKIDAGVDLGGGATGGGSDEIFYENGQTVTADYTLTTNTNAMSTGPVTVNTGVTVTIPTGSRYVVI